MYKFIKLRYKPINNIKVYLKSLLKGFILYLGVIFLVFLAFATNHNFYPVYGQSMLPTFHDKGDNIFVNLTTDVERGDVVVGYYEDIRLIKRLIGVGGDKIAVKYDENLGYFKTLMIYSGTTEIVELDEPYVVNKPTSPIYEQQRLMMQNKNKTYEKIEYQGVECNFIVVPEHYFFVAGDNRQHSTDSFTFGPIPERQLIGKVELGIKDYEISIFSVALYILGIKGGY